MLVREVVLLVRDIVCHRLPPEVFSCGSCRGVAGTWSPLWSGATAREIPPVLDVRISHLV
jgi:hypothetical protein